MGRKNDLIRSIEAIFSFIVGMILFFDVCAQIFAAAVWSDGFDSD